MSPLWLIVDLTSCELAVETEVDMISESVYEMFGITVKIGGLIKY